MLFNKWKSKKMFFTCSVCGYDRLRGPLYANGIPDFNLICACCGFQPGYDDLEQGYTFEEYRTEWIEDNGAKWFDSKEKPAEWELQTQLNNIGVTL